MTGTVEVGLQKKNGHGILAAAVHLCGIDRVRASCSSRTQRVLRFSGRIEPISREIRFPESG